MMQEGSGKHKEDMFKVAKKINDITLLSVVDCMIAYKMIILNVAVSWLCYTGIVGDVLFHFN